MEIFIENYKTHQEVEELFYHLRNGHLLYSILKKMIKLSQTDDEKEMTKIYINQSREVLTNLISEKECKKFLKEAEKKLFVPYDTYKDYYDNYYEGSYHPLDYPLKRKRKLFIWIKNLINNH